MISKNPMMQALAQSLSAQLISIDTALFQQTLLLLGEQLADGHTALSFDAFARKRILLPEGGSVECPDAASWESTIAKGLAQLDRSYFVLHDGLLSTSAFYEQELFIVENLRSRSLLSTKSPLPLAAPVDWQEVAVQNSLQERLSLIVGGPGTGKTTTVARVIQQILLKEGHRKYQLALAAPTGKAAARMGEALSAKMAEMALAQELKARVPDKALTLHRLLGWSVTQRRYKHNKHKPLLLDCLIVDEVSMIDVPMFYAMLQALPDHCRLILLGDPYQLPSVEAGALLANLTYEQAISEFSLEKTPCAAANTPLPFLADNLVKLQKSYRFDDDKGIGALAKACLTKDSAYVDKGLDSDEVTLIPKNESGLAVMKHQMIAHWQAIASEQSLEDAFETLIGFQVLCANKEGVLSTAQCNSWMMEEAKCQGLVRQTGSAELYHGMPVMMEKNRYDLGIFNGDLGLVWQIDGTLWLCFQTAEGESQRFLPPLLEGAWKPAHAISVHKSQGSEYNEVVFILPDKESPLLSNQLVYTAITRAKQRVSLVADKDELEFSLFNTYRRVSFVSSLINKT